MTENSNQPKEYDLVLGGNNPSPVDGLVLGGIQKVKRQLASNNVKAKMKALQDALNYKDEGLDLIIKALDDESGKVHRLAYSLIKDRIEVKAQKALKQYKFWDLTERLQDKGFYYDNTTRFANRKVEEFNPQIGIVDPVKIAYIVEERNFSALLADPQINKLQALILTWGWDDYINYIINAKDKLTSLEALHTGPCNVDYMMSWLGTTDISPILKTYPQLKLLQVRGYITLEPLEHNSLETLIIESSGLTSENIAQISSLKLPQLKHLELWLGGGTYGDVCWLSDLHSILYDGLFPRLTYLGLCNSAYSDDIAEEISQSPELKFIDTLDLSLGTLTDRGAEILLKCPEIKQIRILNVSNSYLSEEMITKLQEELPICVIADRQKTDDGDYADSSGYRYCTVTE